MTAETRAAGHPALDTTRAHIPHVIFREVLGPSGAAGLLQQVAAREKDFRPAVVRNRRSGERRVDKAVLDSLYLRDCGSLTQQIETFLRQSASRILSELHLEEPLVEPRESEICAYRDGNHLAPHIDTNEVAERVRVVSCVYYFPATPRRFSGGELRLYGFPARPGRDMSHIPPFIDISPETDTLVAFPSWLRHEVRPVQVPSGLWTDSRFTINYWLHRTH
jgi:SM-20-related protein